MNPVTCLVQVCNHRFHSACLQRWGDTSCPVCRYCSPSSNADSRCASCSSSQARKPFYALLLLKGAHAACQRTSCMPCLKVLLPGRTCGCALYAGTLDAGGIVRAMQQSTVGRTTMPTPWSWRPSVCGTTPMTTMCTAWCSPRRTANSWSCPALRHRRPTLQPCMSWLLHPSMRQS